MSQEELVVQLAKKLCINKIKAKTILDNIFEIISDHMSKKVKVKIPTFGTFEIKNRGPRRYLNPKTKEKIHVQPKKIICFTPSKKLIGKIK